MKNFTTGRHRPGTGSLRASSHEGEADFLVAAGGNSFIVGRVQDIAERIEVVSVTARMALIRSSP
jgi:hypothetical protein